MLQLVILLSTPIKVFRILIISLKTLKVKQISFNKGLFQIRISKVIEQVLKKVLKNYISKLSHLIIVITKLLFHQKTLIKRINRSILYNLITWDQLKKVILPLGLSLSLLPIFQSSISLQIHKSNNHKFTINPLQGINPLQDINLQLSLLDINLRLIILIKLLLERKKEKLFILQLIRMFLIIILKLKTPYNLNTVKSFMHHLLIPQ